MKTTIAALLTMMLVVPAVAQQRQVPARAPAESIWGRSTDDLTGAFNRSMAARRLTPRLDAMACDVTIVLACDAVVRGVHLRVAGVAEPEQVREVRIPLSRTSRGVDIALVAHTLMAVMEPAAAEEDRTNAVLSVLGIGRAQVDTVTVGRTELKFADSFAGASLVFRHVPR